MGSEVSVRLRAGVWMALVIAGVLVLAACGSPPPADTGVEGVVAIGPTCPVVQVGQDCPDQPYAADLTVANPHGKIIARASADADGLFRIALVPGGYVLEAKASDDSPFPSAATFPFTVQEGTWTRLDVTLDSGIR
jgi:hypothetical protein